MNIACDFSQNMSYVYLAHLHFLLSFLPIISFLHFITTIILVYITVYSAMQIKMHVSFSK